MTRKMFLFYFSDPNWRLDTYLRLAIQQSSKKNPVLLFIYSFLCATFWRWDR